jgi:hypothetical protein
MLQLKTDFLVDGILRKEKKKVMYTITKIPNGFQQRCTDIVGYNRDYISKENMTDLKKWLQVDFKSFDLIYKPKDNESSNI